VTAKGGRFNPANISSFTACVLLSFDSVIIIKSRAWTNQVFVNPLMSLGIRIEAFSKTFAIWYFEIMKFVLINWSV